MKFTEILEELKKGEKVTREEWEKVKTYRYKYIKLEHGDCIAYLKDGSVRRKGEELTTWVGCVFGCADFTAEDWKIWVEKPKDIKIRNWQPKQSEIYYSILANGSIDYTTYDSNNRIDKQRLSSGNCFKTGEEAEHMLEKIKIINQLRKLSNINFNDTSDEAHYAIAYDVEANEITFNVSYYYKDLPFNIYFATEEALKKAVETIGEDNLKKYYFDIKDNQ